VSSGGERWDDFPNAPLPESDPLPPFAEGEELDVCVAGSRLKPTFDGEWTLELICQVLDDRGYPRHWSVDGEQIPVRLSMFIRLRVRHGLAQAADGAKRRTKGRRSSPGVTEFLPVGRGTKFYRMWVIANGGRKPTRRDRMSTSVFQNRLLRARVTLVTKDHEQQKIADPYPILSEFL
jgi:hypothetical protein